jgi:hypothetical protein
MRLRHFISARIGAAINQTTPINPPALINHRVRDLDALEFIGCLGAVERCRTLPRPRTRRDFVIGAGSM